MVAKIIAQLILAGSQVFGRALSRAIRQELETSRQAASKRPSNIPPPIHTSEITVSEAMKILNVDDLDPEKIEQNYKRLFDANSIKNGGTFYLQSKIFRAKERLDQELGIKR